MKMRKSIIMIAGCALFFVACQKKDQLLDPSIEGNGNPIEVKGDAQALKNFFASNETNATQSFTIDVANPQLITGSGGLTLQFYANSFETQSGQTVTGNVEIKLLEVYNKRDMFLLNKPTMGKTWLGELNPLISGGEFKVMAYQNNQQLRLKSGFSYSATVPAPGGADPQMSLFYGDTTNDTLIWNPADSGQLWGTGNLYNGIFDSLGWINCDYFYNDPRPKTFVEVEIPHGFTNQTCAVFVWFDGLNSLTSFYNYSNGVYTTAPSYKLPVGLNVHFIAISFIGGNPHVAIVPSTIVNNHHEVISSLNATTLAQLAIDISALP